MDLIAEADFNGDGKPDYLLFNQLASDSNLVLNNNASGSASGPTVPRAGYQWRLGFNGDGAPDLVLFNPTTNQTRSGTEQRFFSGKLWAYASCGFLLISAW
jgi:hypothetical protein